MPGMTLVIGNKNYSSWSLRAWLMAKRTGADFKEILIPLHEDGFKERIKSHSAAGFVPVLKTGGRTVWDSLAIGEHLAEAYPNAALWPADPMDRAEARSVSCEMHSGFTALRAHMPMDMKNHLPGYGAAAGVAEDIERIADIWRTCRGNHAAGGDFLFGGFSIADAMFAPVASRFKTYGVVLDDVCRAYADAIWAWPDMREWTAAAEAEPWIIEQTPPPPGG